MVSNLRVLQNEELKKHTTFKIGGLCKYLIYPLNQEGIFEAINFSKEKNLPYIILGNGSNILASDNGFDGVIIKLTAFNGMQIENDTLRVKSGALMSKVGKLCLNHELSGFEKLAGIPGTIGGAIVMNAGAYGAEISDCLVSSTYMDVDGKIIKLDKNDHDFSYRHSFYIENPNFIILDAVFKLKKEQKDAIKFEMDECTRKRIEKQPIEFRSAGSTFKRPTGNFAGKLIEDAGLKGYRVGGACVSKKHAGFVVNDKNATCSDVKKLIKDVQEQVYEKYNVKLECEIKMIGD